MKKILKNNAVQSLIASLLCILLGLLVGYIVLLFINPAGAWDSIVEVLKNFLHSPRPERQLRSLGTTLDFEFCGFCCVYTYFFFILWIKLLTCCIFLIFSSLFSIRKRMILVF